MTGPSHRERERERDRHRRERDRKRSPSLDARDFERAALRARREERPNPRAERERERGSSRDLKRPPPTHAGSSASGGRPRAVSPDAMLRYGSPEEEDEGDSKPNKKRKTDKDVGGSRKERQESAEEGEI